MDNRSNILHHALHLFAARGYDAVGIQEVVDAAGITKPTLYYYFGSKEKLLEEVLAEPFTEMFQNVQAAAAYQGDLPLTLYRIVVAYFKFANQNRLFYRMILSMWFAPTDSVAFKAVSQMNEKQQALLEDLFTRAVKEHGNMRGRHKAYAATFLGMINTYIALALNNYATINDELAYQAVRQFMHGIFS